MYPIADKVTSIGLMLSVVNACVSNQIKMPMMFRTSMSRHSETACGYYKREIARNLCNTIPH